MKSRAGLISAVVSVALMGIAWAAAPASADNGWAATDVVADTGKPKGADTAMADDGRGFAVWASSSGTRLAIHEPNGAWGEPISIPSSKANDPVIAANGSGEAVIAWRQLGTEHTRIHATVLGTNGLLSPPLAVSVEDEMTGEPAVAIDADGGIAIAWTTSDGLTFTLRESTATAFRTPMVLIGTENDADEAAVAIDGDEAVTFAWTEDIEGDRLVRSAGIDLDTSNFRSPETISEEFEDAFEPQIALNSEGAGSIAWGSRPEDGDAETLAVSRDAAASDWGAIERISDEDVDAREPQVGVDEDGEVLYAWAESGGADAEISGASWDAVNGYSGPFQFEAGDDAASPSVAVNGDGDSLVSWREGGAADGTIQTAVRAAEAESFTTTWVGGEGVNGPPAAAIEDDGNAFVAWGYRESGAGPGSGELLATGYDAGAPLVSALDVPAKALVGESVPVAASTWSVWNLDPTVLIEFGDGGSAESASAEHTFGAPGTYTVSATAQNTNGLTSEPRTATIEVTAPKADGGKPAGTKPAGTKRATKKTQLALVSPRSVKIVGGAVVLKLENRGTQAVKGTLRLWTTARLDPQSKRTEVGSQAYRLAAGKSKRITVKLSAPALQLIRNKRTHRLATKATASFTDSAGKPGKTSQKVLLLGN